MLGAALGLALARWGSICCAPCGRRSWSRIELVDSRKRTLRLDRADGSEVIEIATEVTVPVTRTRERDP